MWINVVELGRHNQREHHGRSLSAAILTREQPCLSAESQASKNAFRCTIRQADPAVVDEAGEVAPAFEHVVDRLDHHLHGDGDGVNVAARLEGEAPPGGIVFLETCMTPHNYQ